ncbi:hypothetical protein DVH24_005678 [Malus domestica]|uniref:Uncharacterized protein n=1 Tax=Malus domestica TaxID=3750 RepID=A0A498IMR5_MALDO|nr:hypothetical protein DVH24_005678 [Malus domestica]
MGLLTALWRRRRGDHCVVTGRGRSPRVTAVVCSGPLGQTRHLDALRCVSATSMSSAKPFAHSIKTETLALLPSFKGALGGP